MKTFPSFDFATQSFTGGLSLHSSLPIGAAIVNTTTPDMTLINYLVLRQFGAPYDYFVAVLTGSFKVKVAGSYDFWTGSSQGSRLWIDSALVVDNGGGGQVYSVSKGTVSLSTGLHSILVQFFASSSPYLQVSYSGADTDGKESPIDPQSDTCTACVEGKYKTSTGSAVCTECGVGTYSTAVGASASSTCIDCPSNGTSPAGSGSLSNCTSLLVSVHLDGVVLHTCDYMPS
jgi:hypothetical protein